MASNAESLFSKIVGDGPTAKPDAANEINQLITDRVKENEFLEYKGAKHFNNDRDAVMRIWSKSLSAFANTGGGVLIWGVDCREGKKQNGKLSPDEPKDDPSLCEDVNVVHKYLSDLISTATADPVEGVKLRCVPVQGNCGFVVCFIPAGTNRPYRARNAGDVYYVRDPERTSIASHTLLRNLFYPWASANIVIIVSTSPVDGAPFNYSFQISAKNVGKSTVRDLFLRMKLERPMTLKLLHNWRTVESVMVHEKYSEVGLATSQSIHPTQTVFVGEWVWPAGAGQIDFNIPFAIDFQAYFENGESPPLHAAFQPVMLKQPLVVVASPIDGSGTH